VPLYRGRIIFVSNGVEYSAEQGRDDPPHVVPIRFFIYDNRGDRPAHVLRQPIALWHVTSHVDRYQAIFESLHRQHVHKAVQVPARKRSEYGARVGTEH